MFAENHSSLSSYTRRGTHYYGLYGEAPPWATQWPIQGKARGAELPLFLEKTEAQRAEKKIGGDRPPPPYLRFWTTGLPPYLKVWIGHCYR